MSGINGGEQRKAVVACRTGFIVANQIVSAAIRHIDAVGKGIASLLGYPSKLFAQLLLFLPVVTRNSCNDKVRAFGFAIDRLNARVVNLHVRKACGTYDWTLA
jgi:hypothetical protein